ncbi:MAG: flagellar biosynthetic protein FliR [Proteobacteria bacterium]|nr:flagellar biosynthetic protein FliR [Pseudomonadota bacterium]
MINISSAQLDIWLATLMFPMVRLLALISSSPIFGNKQVPKRVKIGLATLLAIVIAPTLDPMPAVALSSPQGLLIIVQQIIIGTAMGFTMRLIFTAVEMAGEFSGLQMGLGFASFYDPSNSSYSPVIAQWLGIIASLAFLAMNGHLIMISLVAESFHTLPVGEMMASKSFYAAALWGASIFAYALQISLPLLAALLITNLALGILTRAAQQLNLFAIGFPLTLSVGFFVLSFSMPYFSPIMDRLTTEALATALKLVKLPETLNIKP